MGAGTLRIRASSAFKQHHVRGPVGCGLRWGLGMGGGATVVKTTPLLRITGSQWSIRTNHNDCGI